MNPEQWLIDKLNQTQTLAESAAVLEILLTGGYAVWTDGRLYNVKQLVARVAGLRIEIYAKEHPPPHFHIAGGGINAAFAISDGTLTTGTVGRRERDLIEWWYTHGGRRQLVATWNATRPTDCPVGRITDAP